MEEMDKFLETHNLPRLNHKGKENLNRPIFSKETESITKTSQQIKAQDHMVSLINSSKGSRFNNYPSQTLLKNRKERNSSENILQG